MHVSLSYPPPPPPPRSGGGGGGGGRLVLRELELRELSYVSLSYPPQALRVRRLQYEIRAEGLGSFIT